MLQTSLPSSSLVGHRCHQTGSSSEHEFQEIARVKTVQTSQSRLDGNGGGALRNGQTEKKPGCCQGNWIERTADRCTRCITKFTRLFLVIPNIIFLLFGSSLIGMGVWMRADRESLFYAEILRNVPAGPLVTFDKFPVVIIAVGSCVAVLSFLGCCGACAESVCFLCLYTLFLLLIVVAEVVLGLIVIIMREQIQLKLESSMIHQVKFEYNATSTATVPTGSPNSNLHNNTYVHHFTKAWDKMQTQFECCGSVGPEDYIDSIWYNRSKSSATFVPKSCCYQTDRTIDMAAAMLNRDYQNCQSDAKIYLKDPAMWHRGERRTALKTQGCKQSLTDIFRRNITIVIGIVSGVVILQIIDFIFACVLMRFFHKKMEEPSWYDEEDYD